MSTSIDERIVEMRFDNKQFEENASRTMSTLDKLKAALHFDNIEKNFSGINKAASSVDMSNVGLAADSIREKFSAMEIVGITALVNITNRAVDAGIKMAKALSIDNISAGFDKYGEYTSSVQAIIAATGKDIEFVEEQIEKLNWFSDETSYSLTDMTNNIAKFTSNGIQLEDAVTQMIGIANAAGLAGSGVESASHAMEGFSKAMGAGYMGLQNWKWIQTARMDTQQFKQIMIDAGVELGKLKKKGDGLYETLKGDKVSVSNFTEAMKDKWITNDVMGKALSVFGKFTEVLNKAQEAMGLDTTSDLFEYLDEYRAGTLDLVDLAQETQVPVEKLQEMFKELTKDEYALGEKSFRLSQEAKTFQEAIDSVKDAASTKWMGIFKDIFGNYEEAKVLWTGLANSLWDFFVGPIDALKTEVDIWKDDPLGGREALLEGVKNVLEGISSLLEPIRRGFSEMFPPLTADKLIDLTRRFKEFSETLFLNEDAQNGLYIVSKGFFAVLKAGLSVIGSAIKIAGKILGIIIKLVVKILELVSAIAGFVRGVIDAVKETQAFKDTMNAIHNAFDFVKGAIAGFNSVFKEFIGNLRNMPGVKNLLSVFDTIKSTVKSKAVSLFSKVFEKIGVLAGVKIKLPKLDGVADVIDKIADAIANLLRKLPKVGSKARSFVSGFKDLPIVQESVEAIQNAFGKISEFVAPLGDKIPAAFSGLFGGLGGINISKISSFFSSAFSRMKFNIGNIHLSDVFEGVGNIISKISSPFSKIAGKIKDFFGDLKNSDNIFETIKDKVSSLWDTVSEKFKDFFALLKDNPVISKLLDAFENMGPIAKTAADALGFLAEKIKDLMFEVDLKQIAAFAFVLVLLNLMMNISDAVKKVGGAASSLSGFVDTVKKLFGLKPPVKSKITVFAEAFAMIAGALAALTLVDQEKLKSSAKVMGQMMVLMGIIVGIFQIISSLNFKAFQSADMTGLGITMVGFAAAMLILIGALKAMESVNMDGIQQRLLVMATIAFTLVVIAALLANGVSGKGALSIAATALFIFAFSKVITALEQLSNVDPKKLQELVKGLVPVMFALGVLAFGAGQIGLPSAIGLIAVILMLKWALPELEKIGTFDFTKVISALQQAIDSTKLLGILVGAMIYIAIFSKNLKEFGTFLLMTSFSLLILVGVVKLISSMSADQVARGTGFIAECIGMFILLEILSSLTHWANFKDFGAGLILISLSLVILVGVVYLLGKINQNDLEKGLAALSVLVILIGILEICSAATGKAKLGPLIAMFLGLAIIIAELVVLSMVPFKDLLGAVLSLSIIIVVLSKLLKSLGKMNKSDMTAVGALAVAIGGVLIIGYVLKELSSLPWTGLLAAAVALSGTLLAIVAAIKILSSIESVNIGALVAFTAICVFALIPIADALATLAGYSWQSMLAAAASLSAVMLAVSIAIAVLSRVPLAGGIKAAFALVSFFGILAAAFAGLGYVIDLIGADTVNDKIKTFGNILTSVGEAIGGFIGGIGAGIMNTVGPSLENFGTNLSNFATNIEPFLSSMKSIDESVATGTRNLSSAILELTKANFIDGLSHLFGITGDLGSFGDQLKTFGEKMVDFSDTVKGRIDEEAVGAAANAGRIMTELSKEIPNSGGILEKIMGNNDIDKWAAKLSVFANAMVAFSNVVSNGNIDEAAVQNAATCGSIMAALSKELPNTGGVLGWLMGDNDIDKFGAMLPIFGDGMRSFADSLNGANIDESAVQNAANCGSIMAALSKELPNTGGVIGFIMGNNDLGFFGDQLALFGEGIAKFSTSAATIDVGATQRGVNAARSVVNFFSEIEGVNLGTDLLPTQLVNGFDAIGEALVSYSDKMQKVDISQINKAATTVKELAALTSASAELPKIGSNLKALSNVSVDNFLSGFSGAAGKTGPVMVGFVSTCTNKIRSASKNFKTAAQTLVTSFISGLGSRNSSIARAAANMARSGYSSARSYRSSFYNTGEYLVEGFVSGINARISRAAAAAAAMARAAAQAARNNLQVQSPSRVFRKIGEYVPEGFAIGVNRFAHVAVNAVSDFVDDAIKTGDNIENSFASVLDSDFDMDPTIRPVMDLSNVQNGFCRIDGMLDAQRSIDLAANASLDYNRGQIKEESMASMIGTAVDNALNKIYDKIEEASAKTPYQINVPLNIDKRQIARATATVTREELDRLDYFNNRKAGIA